MNQGIVLGSISESTHAKSNTISPNQGAPSATYLFQIQLSKRIYKHTSWHGLVINPAIFPDVGTSPISCALERNNPRSTSQVTRSAPAPLPHPIPPNSNSAKPNGTFIFY